MEARNRRARGSCYGSIGPGDIVVRRTSLVLNEFTSYLVCDPTAERRPSISGKPFLQRADGGKVGLPECGVCGSVS